MATVSAGLSKNKLTPAIQDFHDDDQSTVYQKYCSMSNQMSVLVVVIYNSFIISLIR